jgi:hypothetical protein
MSAPRFSVAAPAVVRDIQRPNRSRWYAGYHGPGRNVVRHDRSGRNDSVVANGHAGKDRCRSTDPDVDTETNWRDPRRTRRFQGMVVGVENGHQIPEPAIVTEYDAVIGYDRGTRVDEDTLAEHEGAIWAGAHLDWDVLAAQEQASALDRSCHKELRAPPVHRHNG